MPDIIVTTPKNQMAEAAREAEEVKAAGGGYYYRNYHGTVRPNVGVGDRVYYVEDGYIRGFCLVCSVCRSSQGLLSRIYMDATTWTWIRPIPAYPPRSWRYADNFGVGAAGCPLTRESKMIKIVGGWLDPKPKASLEVEV
jgi:hypothetical protein